MKIEKLEWLKKITLKQVAMMCVMMVVIYFVATPFVTTDAPDQTNMVGSMGASYEVTPQEETHTVFARHTSGYMVKTEIVQDLDASLVASIFTGIQMGSERLADNVEGLIPMGAVLRDYQTDNGILTLNLSESFLYYRSGVEDQLLTSLVWSMTALPHIERVHFQIEGESVTNLNGPTDVGRGLTRAMGINLETDGTPLSQTQMIMLYFFTNEAENPHLIPVTRLISRNEDPFEHAVGALVRGPIGADYISVFNHQATLLEQPKLENGIMTLNFSSDLFFDQAQTQVSSQVIKQLVMTLTEFDEITEVSVVVEGSSRVFDDAGNPITVPVGRQMVLSGEMNAVPMVKEY